MSTPVQRIVHFNTRSKITMCLYEYIVKHISRFHQIITCVNNGRILFYWGSTVPSTWGPLCLQCRFHYASKRGPLCLQCRSTLPSQRCPRCLQLGVHYTLNTGSTMPSMRDLLLLCRSTMPSMRVYYTFNAGSITPSTWGPLCFQCGVHYALNTGSTMPSMWGPLCLKHGVHYAFNVGSTTP